MRVHGTCVEVEDVAVLLRGPPGAGKSDLALRLIDAGAVLIADDQVDLSSADGALRASSPSAIAGMIEVRGLGLAPVPWRASAVLALVVNLVAPDAVARLPEPATVRFLGVGVPAIDLAPLEASAPAKVRLAARLARTGRLAALTDGRRDRTG